jgi:hypothetical protein
MTSAPVLFLGYYNFAIKLRFLIVPLSAQLEERFT